MERVALEDERLSYVNKRRQLQEEVQQLREASKASEQSEMAVDKEAVRAMPACADGRAQIVVNLD